MGRVELHPIPPGAEEGHVYIFKDAKGLVKVGFAHCAISRFKVLRSKVARNRQPLQFVRAIRMERRLARRAETIAHRALKPFDAGLAFSEWYCMDMAVVATIVEAAVDDALVGAKLPTRRGVGGSPRFGIRISDEERATARGLWFSPRFETDLERLTAIKNALGRRITQYWCWRHFGSPNGTKAGAHGGE